MGKDLEKMKEQAYTDKEVYEFLKKNHNLQWQAVVQRIVLKHFSSINKEEK